MLEGIVVAELELSEVIAKLRGDLIKAQQEGEGKDLKFAISEVSVELQIGVTREASGSAGLKFWVLDLNGSTKGSNATTQKITLKMNVESASGTVLFSTDLESS
jgi:hypothetical protein